MYQNSLIFNNYRNNILIYLKHHNYIIIIIIILLYNNMPKTAQILEYNDPSDNIEITARILRSANDCNLHIETSNNLIFNASNFKLNENNLKLGTPGTSGDVSFTVINNNIIYEVSGSSAKIILKQKNKNIDLVSGLVDLSTIYLTEEGAGLDSVLTISATDWSLNIAEKSLAQFTGKNYLLDLSLINIDISNNINVNNGKSIVKTLHATETQFNNLDVSNNLYVNNNVTISNELIIGNLSDINNNSKIYIENNELIIKPPKNNKTVNMKLSSEEKLEVSGNITGIDIQVIIAENDISNITLANDVSLANRVAVDGAGFWVGDNSFATFLYNDSLSKWESNIDFNVAGNLTTTGDVSAVSFIGDLSGTADKASRLETGRNIKIQDPYGGTGKNFDGSANITLPFTMPEITLGTHTTGKYMTDLSHSSTSSNYLTVTSGGGSEGAIKTINLNDVSDSLVSNNIVKRDASASIHAESITANTIQVTNYPFNSPDISLIDQINTSTQKIPVTRSTYEYKFHTLDSKLICDALPTMQDLSDSYFIHMNLISKKSAVYLNFKIHFVCSYESDQTISFFIHRDPPIFGNSLIFQDLSMGTNMGIINRNIYNGIYIDNSDKSSNNVKYYLKYLLSSESVNDTIDGSSGILGFDDGYQNFIMAQELYVPSDIALL